VKIIFKNIALLVSISLVAACVSTRDANPVAMQKDGDLKTDCKTLTVEYKSNSEAAAGKIKSNRKHDRKELWYGIFIWPGLMDFKNADGVEGNALLDRNARIKEIAASKKCDVKDWPVQPVRY
jgi:hypothetical protein